MDKADEPNFHIYEESDKIKDNILEDIQTKLDAVTYKEVLQKAIIMCLYPPE